MDGARLPVMTVEDDRPTISYKTRALLGQVLYSQYENNSDFCDVTLVIHGKESKAHWCVLMVSPYFEALYKSGLMERQSGRIQLDFEDEASIEAIIKYMYTGEVVINLENIRPLLRTADYFLLPCFKLSCEAFFASFKCPAISNVNCVELCLIGAEFDLSCVYQRAFNYITKNFETIVESDNLLTLSDDTVRMLLTNSYLNHIKGGVMFKFIKKWTEHDLSNRSKYFSSLFLSLDLQKFTKETFQELSECPLVVQTSECLDRLVEFQKKVKVGIYRLLPADNCDWKDVFVFLGGCLNQPDYFSRGHELGFVVEDKRWCLTTQLGHYWALEEPFVVSFTDGNIYMTDGDSQKKSEFQRFYIFTVSESSPFKGWSWVDVKRPTKHFCVRRLLGCGNEVYAVCSSELCWKLYKVSFNTEGECISGRFQHKSKLFQVKAHRRKDPLFQCHVCVIEEKMVCVHAGSHTKRDAYFAVVDTSRYHRALFFCSVNFSYYPVMFSIGNETVLLKISTPATLLFDLNTKKLQSYPEFLVKTPLPVSVNRVCFSYLFYFNQLFIFGGLLHGRKLDSAFCYSFERHCWERLANLPSAMYDGAICVRPILKRHLSLMRCNICNLDHVVE